MPATEPPLPAAAASTDVSPTPADAPAPTAAAPAPVPLPPTAATTAGVTGPTTAAAPPTPPAQPRNPLHGVTLQALLEALVAHYGWQGLGTRVPVRCFTTDPSIGSGLKFLRKTPWAREKVESLYLFMLREQRRGSNRRSGDSRDRPR